MTRFHTPLTATHAPLFPSTCSDVPRAVIEQLQRTRQARRGEASKPNPQRDSLSLVLGKQHVVWHTNIICVLHACRQHTNFTYTHLQQEHPACKEPEDGMKEAHEWNVVTLSHYILSRSDMEFYWMRLMLASFLMLHCHENLTLIHSAWRNKQGYMF